jgi:integrase/recombinase XerD
MSDVDGTRSVEKVAAAFGKTTDPLAEYEPTFEELETDAFVPFIEDVLFSKDLHGDTLRNYRSVFADWREHMDREERHPACPSDSHVIRFIEWQLSPDGADNHPRTVKGKLRKLNRAYRFWQDSPAFPHPADYNPFTIARNSVDLTVPDRKPHRRMSVSELREIFEEMTNLRTRAVIALQFKLGLRAGETANIKLSDIGIDNAEVKHHYPSLGTADRLADRSNVIYIPPGKERPGNKSGRARMLPLDDEVRRLLVQYLLIRPQNGEPWLFLSQRTHTKMDHKGINKVWKKELHPEYDETEEHRPITSHFGRHRFTTWWKVQQDVNRELVKYMRGDSVEKGSMEEPIDAYLHTYYEDIEALYRENIYRLGI